MAEKQNSKMQLRIRPPAYGLSTGCPKCLPPLFYLRLAKVAFNPVYAMLEPDSDELPIVEIGELAGFSNECGGVEEFLKSEQLADLDEDLADDAKADLLPLKSLLLHLENALMYELWSKENEAMVARIYFSQIPWPISKAIEWNMRRKVRSRLGINKNNATERAAQIYKEAFAAYEALAKKQGHPYFMNERPTSLDAGLLAHLCFVLCVPLENSLLKEELKKHPSLVTYADNQMNELLVDSPEASLPESPKSTRKGPSSSTSSSKNNQRGSSSESKDRKPTQKERSFKRKAKQFIAVQIAAVVVYVVLTGLQSGDDEDE